MERSAQERIVCDLYKKGLEILRTIPYNTTQQHAGLAQLLERFLAMEEARS